MTTVSGWSFGLLDAAIEGKFVVRLSYLFGQVFTFKLPQRSYISQFGKRELTLDLMSG